MDTVQIVFIIVWAVVLIGTILIEIETAELVSVWFIVGALIALILAIINVEWTIQIFTFAGVSAIGFLFLFLRKSDSEDDPDKRTCKTLVIGQSFKVNADKTITIDGAKWEIRNNEKIKKGDQVTIKSVSGSKVTIE